MNVASETGSTNVLGEAFKLSDYIKYGVVDGAQSYTRDKAVAAVDANATALKNAYNSGTVTLAPQGEKIVTMVVYMPTSVGNEANYAKGAAAPQINLGINLYATQVEAENDSFGNDYDEAAPIISTPVARPESGTGSDTEDVTLNGLDDVEVTLPGELIDELPSEVLELSLAVSSAKMNTTDNTITFPSIEVVDQNGEIVDLEALDSGIKITVTIPAQTMFAPGTTVMIYHDGEYIATATVNEDTTITYEAEHLCEVTIGTTKAPVVNEDNVIKIGTAAELMGLAQSVNAGNDYKGKTVVLTNNIDLNNVAWTPIGTNANPFRANFDGANLTVSNINVENEGWAGLIGHAGLGSAITIKNLTVKNVTINSNRMAGAIVGQLYGSIDNCHVENVTINVTPNAVGESYDNGDKVGGIVGWIGDNGNNRTLTNCTATNVTLSGYRDIGGIAGYVASSTTVANNTVTNYTITADQTVNFYGEKDVNAGAIIGRVNGTITEEGNEATGDESKITTIYYKNGLVLKASSDSEEVLLYEVPSSYTSDTVIVPEGVTNLGRALVGKTFAKLVIPATVTSAYKSLETATIDEIVISEGAATIPNRMFYKANIGNVEIPSTVTVIEQNAFAMAVVTEVVIPASVTTIEEAAFTHADYLETVTIMGNTAIQGYAFRGCDRLRTVYLYGDDVTFVASTLNGRNSTWFCNSESNNPNVSDITFTVRSEVIKERVLTAMGAERNNTTVIVDDGFIKVESTEEFLAELKNATAGTKINATGLTLVPTGDLSTTVTIPAGVTIKGANFASASQCYLVTSGVGEDVVFENCTFDGPGFGMFVVAGNDQDGAAMVFENCVFKGQIAPNFVQNSNGTATFNNCRFTVGSDNIGLVNCMGGTHTFNNCTFDYAGGSTLGSNQYVKWNAVNSYSERYSTNVILNGCTFINCGTQRFGSNSTLTIK